VPAVSIITPAFRAETFIMNAVKSVLAQTSGDWEWVIASDDGQDYCAILVSQGIDDRRIRHISTGGVRTGSSHTRNVALRAAQSRFIAPLDCDDALLPAHLERMLPLAEKHGVALTQVEYFDHATAAPLPNRTKPFPSGLLALDEILLACLHGYNPIVFDRTRITHGWQEKVPLLTDAMFLVQCYNTLPSVWYEASPTYRYYKRSDSVCNDADAAQRFLAAGRIIIDLLDSGEIPATPLVAKVLRAYIARNDSLEHAFEAALNRGEVKDYQDFLGRNLPLLHTPLL
jgi:succinoglycan biosynthesis protein ExoO